MRLKVDLPEFFDIDGFNEHFTSPIEKAKHLRKKIKAARQALIEHFKQGAPRIN